MFGYIFPDKPELKVKEYELFKAYYCGLCKSIGKNCSQVGRFALNYDSSFLGLFLSSFKDSPEVIRFEKCPASPFVKKPVIKESKAIDYAADMNIILAYYKLMDDFKDEGSVKSLTLMGVFKRAFKHSTKRNPDKDKKIKQYLDELSSVENSDCKSVDQAAEPFARLTEELFAYAPLFDIKNNEIQLRRFGYNIGKWIYIIDALDDIEKDVKNKNFNPILNQFCYNNEKITDFKNRIQDNMDFTLTYTLSEVGKTFELLDIKKNAEIIENIIFGGMYNKTLQILNKRSCVNNEKPL